MKTVFNPLLKKSPMAKLPNGILGAFSGTVGPVIGQTWKGMAVMRSKPGPRKTPPSIGQRAQMSKFKVVSEFVHGFKKLMSFSFKTGTERITAPNLAYRLNLANALTGEFPNIKVDYPKALVSLGAVGIAENPTASLTENNHIIFNWTNNSGQPLAYSTDSALLVAYCPGMKKGIYKTAAAHRSDGTAVLDVEDFEGYTVHTWLSFMSEDGLDVSTSVYVGEVNVQIAQFSNGNANGSMARLSNVTMKSKTARWMRARTVVTSWKTGDIHAKSSPCSDEGDVESLPPPD